jgi:hypothetical protein
MTYIMDLSKVLVQLSSQRIRYGPNLRLKLKFHKWLFQTHNLPLARGV